MNQLEIRSLVGLVSLYATRMLGLFMVLPVLAVFSDQYSGASEFTIGLALGIYGLTQALFQIPLGMLSDRIGRKTVIVGGMVLFLLGSLVAATAESMHTLILGRALQGAGAVASTIMALLSDLTTEQNRTKAMAAVGGSIGLAFALAMVLGPALAASAGMSAIFWVTAAMAVLGILVVLYWIPTPVSSSSIAAREALAMPSLFRSTLSNGELLRLDFGVFTLHLAQMAGWVAVPWMLQHQLGFGVASHWWLYLLTMGLGFVAMLPFIIIGERRRRMKPVFVGAVALLLVSELVFYAGTYSLWLFVLGLLLFFTAFNLLEASLPSLVSKVAASGSRGTAMGIYSSSQFLGSFAGGVLGGLVAQYWGHGAIFVLLAGVAALWLGIAATMPRPRHWSSVVVNLADSHANGLSPEDIRHRLPGVEEVLVIAEQQLMYLKVDRALFDQAELDRLLGRA